MTWLCLLLPAKRNIKLPLLLRVDVGVMLCAGVIWGSKFEAQVLLAF